MGDAGWVRNLTDCPGNLRIVSTSTIACLVEPCRHGLVVGVASRERIVECEVDLPSRGFVSDVALGATHDINRFTLKPGAVISGDGLWWCLVQCPFSIVQIFLFESEVAASLVSRSDFDCSI